MFLLVSAVFVCFVFFVCLFFVVVVVLFGVFVVCCFFVVVLWEGACCHGATKCDPVNF